MSDATIRVLEGRLSFALLARGGAQIAMLVRHGDLGPAIGAAQSVVVSNETTH
jgi:hypothetical protein